MAEINENVIARMIELSPLDSGKAELIATEFGLKARSIIASATRRGIGYVRKNRVGKAGAVISKTDLVTQIAAATGLDAGALEGLEKASKAALQVLAETLEC